MESTTVLTTRQEYHLQIDEQPDGRYSVLQVVSEPNLHGSPGVVSMRYVRHCKDPGAAQRTLRRRVRQIKRWAMAHDEYVETYH